MSARWVKRRLGKVAPFSDSRIAMSELTATSYVSTDSMLSDRKGLATCRTMPQGSGNVPKYVEGDVLIGNIRPYLRKIWHADSSGGASPDVLIFHPSVGLDDEYLFHRLSQDSFFDFMTGSSKGSKMPRGDKPSIEKHVICYPFSTDEQRRIAEILSTCDEVITRSRAVVEKLRKIKAGMLNDFFTRGIGTDGQLRPTLQQAPKLYKDSTLGAIPEDWEVKRLGDVCEVQLGKMLDAAKNVGVEKPYLGNKAVQWGRFDLSAVEKVRLTEDDLRRFRLQKDDLLVCEGGEVGRCAIWNDELPECYYQKAIHRVRLLNSQNGSVVFLANVFAWYAANDRFRPYVTQTSIAHLPKEKLEEVLITCPEKSEQDRIAERLAAMDERIVAEERVIAKYRSVKAGLMQRLLAPPAGAEIVDETNREAV